MSERDLYLMFLPQIAELIIDCQQMTQESYEQWKQETRESIPVDAVEGFATKKEGYDKLPDEALAALKKLVEQC